MFKIVACDAFLERDRGRERDRRSKIKIGDDDVGKDQWMNFWTNKLIDR